MNIENLNSGLNANSSANWTFILHLADNSLILGQRNAEWCGHGPVLEQDIAITNISLDLIGQARNLYQHACELYNNFGEDEKSAVQKYMPRLWKTFNRELQEDDLAFLRDENQYLNLLLTEMPKGDWAYTILRQFLFSAFQQLQFTALTKCEDKFLAGIGEKSLKEINYHLRWSGEWVIRLADGTEESRRRIETALADLWMFTGECFDAAPFESSAALTDPGQFRNAWLKKVEDVFSEGNLSLPKETKWFQSGGKKGIHTEYLGYLLSGMQYLQKTYPNATW